MDFKRDQSWNNLAAILALRTSAKDAWNKFIDFHEQAAPKKYWASLRQLDIEADQVELVDWLQELVSVSPIPDSIIALWIGILKFADNDKEIPTIYLAGADTYDKDDIDWACEPAYSPENRYAQPTILQQIDAIARTDEENYEFFDWIFPLAYCAFTFDEIFRWKIDKQILLRSNNDMFIAVGHDSGDYLDLAPINTAKHMKP